MTGAVLVTGACGLVGAALTESLVRAGRTVVAVDRNPPPAFCNHAWSRGPGTAVPLTADIRDTPALVEEMRRHGVVQVVHGATITAGRDRDFADPEGIVETNVLGTIAVLRAAREVKAGRVIVVSSNAVYGPNAFVGEILDEALTQPNPQTMYSITKLAAERSAQRLGELWGLPLHIARLTSIYGRFERNTGVRDTLSPLFQVTLAARAGEAVTLPSPGIRDWMYGPDVGNALRALLQAPALTEPIYHVSAGKTFSVAEWCAALAHVYPAFSWRLAAEGEKASIDYFGFGERKPMSVERLTRDTAFQSAWPLEKALADWAEWLDANPI